MSFEIIDDRVRLQMAAKLIAELVLLCDVPHKEVENIFVKMKPGAGDYLGTGYAFLDAFEKIYDDFVYNGDPVLQYIINSEMRRIEYNKYTVQTLAGSTNSTLSESSYTLVIPEDETEE